jgi:large subunit ribosomal protein L6
MSRLGKMPVGLGKTAASIDGRVVTVSAGDKSLSYEFRPEVRVELDSESNALVVSLAEGVDPKVKKNRAQWGTTRARLANLVAGVTDGFEKKLEVVGVGYTAQLAGQALNLKVGYANTLSVPVPSGVDVSVEGQMITVKGMDKQAVGQFAAVVRGKRPPEPYNGKGIRYAGEQIIRKEGKAFSK